MLIIELSFQLIERILFKSNILLLFILFSCNNEDESKSLKNDVSSKEQNVSISQSIIDSAKWVAYTTSYLRNDKITCIKDNNLQDDSFNIHQNSSLISFDLSFDRLEKFGDTTVVYMHFFNPSQDYYCSALYNSDIIIFIKEDTLPYRASSSTFPGLVPKLFEVQKNAEIHRTEKLHDSEFSNFSYWYYQKEFVAFITNTKLEINPWLKEECIRRGILKKDSK